MLSRFREQYRQPYHIRTQPLLCSNAREIRGGSQTTADCLFQKIFQNFFQACFQKIFTENLNGDHTLTFRGAKMPGNTDRDCWGGGLWWGGGV